MHPCDVAKLCYNLNISKETLEVIFNHWLSRTGTLTSAEKKISKKYIVFRERVSKTPVKFTRGAKLRVAEEKQQMYEQAIKVA